MSENYSLTPEINKQKDDARKFVLDRPLTREFLHGHQASGYNMTVDWTVIGAGNETKIARKDYNDGTVTMWKVAKTKEEDGSRSAERVELRPETYSQAVASPVKHLEKRRYEFKYAQGDIEYALKYDNVEHDALYLLEVDAETPTLRAQFDADEFASKHGCNATEVSGQQEYEGHFIVDFIKTLK